MLVALVILAAVGLLAALVFAGVRVGRRARELERVQRLSANARLETLLELDRARGQLQASIAQTQERRGALEAQAGRPRPRARLAGPAVRGRRRGDPLGAHAALMRVAAVDLGTNSTRLLVADATGPSELAEVERILEITRLGQGVDATGRLHDDAIGRVLAVVRRYHDVAAAAGAERFLATATSAVRDAANGRDFLARLEAETGFATRLLSGADEARLTRLGTLAGRAPLSGRVAIVDVGGGSTEVSVSDALAVSLDAGCVRATERWLAEDAVAPELEQRAAEALRRLFAVERAGGVAAGRPRHRRGRHRHHRRRARPRACRRTTRRASTATC